MQIVIYSAHKYEIELLKYNIRDYLSVMASIE